MTDGVPKDEPIGAAQAARGAGLILHVLVVPTDEWDPIVFMPLLGGLTGDLDRVWIAPGATAVADLARDLTRRREQDGAFARIAVDDVVPANMDYVDGSAVPAAAWDAARRTLSWTFSARPASAPLLLSYRLRPRQVGTWPTNVEASAPYRDALGNDGRLIFPVPVVEVYDAGARAFLPFAAARGCLRDTTPLDVVVVVDTLDQHDRRGADGMTKLATAREAIAGFLALLRWPSDHAALVSFDSAERGTHLTGDPEALRTALAGMTTAEGTHIDLGLAEARAVLAQGRAPEPRRRSC